MKKINNLAELFLAMNKYSRAGFKTKPYSSISKKNIIEKLLPNTKIHAAEQKIVSLQYYILGVRCRVRILEQYILTIEKGRCFTQRDVYKIIKNFPKKHGKFNSRKEFYGF